MPDFAKLGKASRDAYKPGLLLILKNWVAEGGASDANDFKLRNIPNCVVTSLGMSEFSQIF